MEGNLIQQLVHYYQMNFGYLWELFVNHLLMSVYGVLLACLVGIPLVSSLQDLVNYQV